MLQASITAPGSDYYRWILNEYAGDYSKYTKLMAYLHNIPFRYMLMMDENREEDGANLIYKWAFYNLIPYSDIELATSQRSGCSVLEFIIGVTDRVSVSLDDWVNDRTKDIFWGILNNLGLTCCTDDNFDWEYVDNRIDILLSRRFGPNGEGGLFLFRHDGTSMQYEEFWRHITRYCHENRTW